MYDILLSCIWGSSLESWWVFICFDAVIVLYRIVLWNNNSCHLCFVLVSYKWLTFVLWNNATKCYLLLYLLNNWRSMNHVLYYFLQRIRKSYVSNFKSVWNCRAKPRFVPVLKPKHIDIDQNLNETGLVLWAKYMTVLGSLAPEILKWFTC